MLSDQVEIPLRPTERTKTILAALKLMNAEGVTVDEERSIVLITNPEAKFKPKNTGLGTYYHLIVQSVQANAASRREVVLAYVNSPKF